MILFLALACAPGGTGDKDSSGGGLGTLDDSGTPDTTPPDDSGSPDDSGELPCDQAHPDWATWWIDADGDGYGDPATEQGACEAPAGGVSQAGDCDDADPAAFPGATEVCGDADDDDCDGLVDVAAEAAAWYADADGDGYGDPASTETSCDPPAGWVTDAADCAPDDAARFPGAIEACGDGLDDDCDGADLTCGFSGDYDLADATRVHSEGVGYDAGRWVDVGDATGDGIGDVIAATLYASSYAGGGYLVPGPVDTTGAFEDVGYRFTGDIDTTYGAGRSIGVGDVDGDGVGDVAFGAPYDSDGPGTWILLGPIDGDRNVDEAEVHLIGPPSSYSGHGGDVGDISGDGIADAIVGAYSAARDAGIVFVEYGPLSGEYTLSEDADAIIVGENPSWYTARHARAGDDVNGDGIGDIVTATVYGSGGALNSGIVYVVHGPPMGDLDFADADARLLGVSGGEYAGSSHNAGDLDGDGYEDVLAGSVGSRTAGRVYVVNGPVSGEIDLADANAIIEGATSGQYIGMGGGAGGALAADDADGDGRDDLFAGAYGDATSARQAGAAFLFYGPVAGELTSDDADAAFYGETGGDNVGTSVALGDLDADGLADLVLGAPGFSGEGYRAAGAVYVMPSGR
jgi:hypothetical protein